MGEECPINDEVLFLCISLFSCDGWQGKDTTRQHDVMQQVDEEEEEWRERTEVLTALDHQHNVEMAKDLLDKILLVTISR